MMPQTNLDGTPLESETLTPLKYGLKTGNQEVDEMAEGNEGNQEKKKGRAPDYRICKVGPDGKILKEKLPTGKEVSKDFGAVWKNTSKAGKEYLNISIKGKDGKTSKFMAFPIQRQAATEGPEESEEF